MSFIQFQNIMKSYGDCHACQGISFAVEAGTIHALIGENGAGKSTLMKIFGGLEHASSGEMFIDSKPYKPSSAKDAFRKKIGFVHQHFLLSENQTVLEHLILNWPQSRLFRAVDTRLLLEKVNLFTKKFNWKLKLNTKVIDLSIGEQQRVEIIKALLNDPEIIIFDEPTAVLAPQEIEDFLEFLKLLQTEKKTIILISHKLNEVKAVANTLTVLRQGKSIITKSASDFSVDQIAELLIGRKVVSFSTHVTGNPKADLLKVSKLTLKKNHILGLVGIEGNGQTKLIENILTAAKNADIAVGDIAEDRLRMGVFPDFSLIDHMVLRHPKQFAARTFIDASKALEATKKLIGKWDVRPTDPHLSIDTFSGGNQQKFVVARELYADPTLIIAAHPTRGVDIGAQELIHSELVKQAQNDSSVFLMSSDLDEVLKLADDIIIIFELKLYGPFVKSKITAKEVGQFMTGSHLKQSSYLLDVVK